MSNQRDLYTNDVPKARLKTLRDFYCLWFGGQVERARLECGLTVENMMDALGVSKNQVIKWRKGKDWGNPLVIARIARALHKPFNYFIHPDFRLPIENEEIERFLRVYDAGQAAMTQTNAPPSADPVHPHISVA